MSRKRTKPYFSESTVTSILENFRRSMTEADRHFDDNLIDAVRGYVVSRKSEDENLILLHVANGHYRFLYEGGSASFGVVTPQALKDYKAKYPLPLDELRKDPDLYREAVLDSVEMDIKRHLDEYKKRQANLSASLANINRYAAHGAGNISQFLKHPFLERATTVTPPAAATSINSPNGDAPLFAAAAAAVSGSLSVGK